MTPEERIQQLEIRVLELAKQVTKLVSIINTLMDKLSFKRS